MGLALDPQKYRSDRIPRFTTALSHKQADVQERSSPSLNSIHSIKFREGEPNIIRLLVEELGEPGFSCRRHHNQEGF